MKHDFFGHKTLQTAAAGGALDTITNYCTVSVETSSVFTYDFSCPRSLEVGTWVGVRGHILARLHSATASIREMYPRDANTDNTS